MRTSLDIIRFTLNLLAISLAIVGCVLLVAAPIIVVMLTLTPGPLGGFLMVSWVFIVFMAFVTWMCEY